MANERVGLGLQCKLLERRDWSEACTRNRHQETDDADLSGKPDWERIYDLAVCKPLLPFRILKRYHELQHADHFYAWHGHVKEQRNVDNTASNYNNLIMKAAGALLIVTVWIILLPRIYDLSPSCASLQSDVSSQCSYTLADPTCFGTLDSVASTCKLTGSCIGTFIGWTRGFLMVVMNALLPLPAQHGTEQ
ncbi:hypothetical protein GUITHDRAFT_153667 [Guillardia theta CCMP2712]|uniref:Uncharacterized protein n=1 Tax=Guillardia theta (strain CCMP2712) TaxID=905079 RepID=L1J0T6_GUITC|nr:hypothetical protein GUITHDRAFT_153667 [Guillardia theta CCMP2712]EKX42126.1 hypothetical protein GUITHDRAFT_153667 [Guillardia theta CCMP2712]|eukprot:XP_005829106.1 hypothetical protein GUITHDRAFT_153667 [Guillardia theta CCMP2712]